MRLHRLLDDLNPQVDIIITVDRSDNLDVGVGGHAISETAHPLFQVQRARNTGQNGYCALRPNRTDQQVCRGLPGLVIIDPQVGEALALGRVGVPRHHRDTGSHGCIDRIDTGSWIVARDCDSIDPACNHIFDHARLLGCIRGHRADIEHLNTDRPAGCQFSRLLEGALAAQLKHRVVERLGDPGDRELPPGRHWRCGATWRRLRLAGGKPAEQHEGDCTNQRASHRAVRRRRQ